MPISVDTQQALQLLERIQHQLKESNDTNAKSAVEEDLITLISVLDSPVFNTILTIQDSLQELKRQLHKHPSILPVDFDITPNSGELLLNVPTNAVANSDSYEPSSDPEQNYEFDSTCPREKVAREKEISSNSSIEVAIPTVAKLNYPQAAITTESYAEEFRRTIAQGAHGREVHNIQLYKPEGSSLGFSVVGLRAEDRGELGIFVQEIQSGGIAGRDGRLQEGDQILAIDGQPLDSNISHQQAISILQQARGLVELIVARGGIPNSEEPVVEGSGQSSLLSNESKESDMVLTTEWAQVEAVDLINDGSGLGFGIIGGKSTGVVVKTILPGGVADRDKRLQSGDHILQIGDVNLRRMGSEEVAMVLRQSGSHVRLVVARPVDPTSPDYNALRSNAPIVPTRILSDPEEVDRHLAMFQHTHNGFSDGTTDYGRPNLRYSDHIHQLKAESAEAIEGSLSTPHLKEPGGGVPAGEDQETGKDLPEMETFEVELVKDQQGLGITIAGYVCEKEEISGIFVKSIAKGSAADSSKRIRVNDQIIEVDGRSLHGYTNHQAVDVLRNTGKIVKLRLARYLRGLKYQQLQQAIASGKLHLPTPATTQVQIHEPKQTTLALDGSNQNDLEEEVTLVDENYTGPLDPRVEAAIKRKWEKIMGPDYEIVVSQLTKFREGGGLGISLEGTVDVINGREERPHHYVRSILTDGPVGINGKLKSGDELLEANGRKLLGLNHVEVVNVLRELPINVRMVCARHKNPESRTPPSSTGVNPIVSYPTFHSTDFDATSMPELNGRNGLPDNYGGSLTSLTPISDRLVKAKSDGSLAVGTSASPEFPFSRLKSRSLEPLTGLAMWCSEPQIIELVKGDRGLGFSILDYQDPMNANETVIVIRSLVPGGVAQQDGRLIPGDRLLFVNDINLENASLDTAVQALKGAPKGVVRIGVGKPLPMPESTQSGQGVIDDFSETRSLKDFTRQLSIDLTSSLPPIPNLSLDLEQQPTFHDRQISTTSTDVPLTSHIVNETRNPLYQREGESPLPIPWEYNISPLPSALERTTKIVKGNEPLGMSIEMIDKNISGVLVKSVTKTGAIHRDGHIRAGDYISAINGKSLRNLSDSEAQLLLKQAECCTEITIKYIPATDAAVHHQSTILTMQHAEPLPLSSVPPPVPDTPLPDSPPPSPPTSPPPLDDDDKIPPQNIISVQKSSPSVSPSILLPSLTDVVHPDDIKLRSTRDALFKDEEKKTETTSSTNVAILPPSEEKITPFQTRSPKPPVPSKPPRKKEDAIQTTSLSPTASIKSSSSVASQKLPQLSPSGRSPTISPSVSGTTRQWGPERTVELWREPPHGLGISIVWGKVDTFPPSSGPSTSGIFIKNVLLDSPAGITGILKRGDRILEVDGWDLREATHDKAVEVIKNSKNPVRFVVQSLVSMPKKLETEKETTDTILAETTKNVKSSGSTNLPSEWASEDILDGKTQNWEELDIGPAPPPPPRTVSKQYSQLSSSDEEEKIEEKVKTQKVERMPPKDGTQVDSSSAANVKLSEEEKASDPEEVDEFGYTQKKIQKKYGDIKNGEIIVVDLQKGLCGLGLSLAGNKDRTKMSVFVCGMHPNGNAAKDGRIKVGDELLEVNGIVMYGRCHLNASAMIKGLLGPVYKLILLRRENALQEMAVKPLTQFPLQTSDAVSEKYSQYKDVRTISVRKGNLGLGIMILEGKHAEVGQGIFISDIQPGSPAEMAGLSVGDMLLAVNETELIGTDYETAASILKKAEGLVTLVVSNPHKSSSTPSLLNDKEEATVVTDASQETSATSPKTVDKKKDKGSPPQLPPKPPHLAVKPTMQSLPQTTSASSISPSQHNLSSSISPAHKFKLLPMPPISSLDDDIDDDESSSSSSSSIDGTDAKLDPKTREITPGQEVTIEICKEKMGLGLSIVGGSDTPLGVIIIHEVYPDGAAAVDGRLRAGDQIMEVNGEDLREAPHERAITALRQTPPVVQMVVYREEGQNHEEDMYDILEVEIFKKPGRGLGLSIVGRKNGPGVFISEVVKGGVAEADGRLMQGDQILEVNDQDLKNATQEYAAAILKTTMGRINMKIGRLKAGSRRSTSGSVSSPKLDDSTEMPLQCKTITLQRGPEGLGFSIVGGYGSPHGNLPIYVKTVFDKGAASQDGNLQRGDQIIAVNNQSLENMTHEEAVNVLKNAKGTVTLTILS